MSLLDTASLLLTPNAYKEGKLYSVIPSDGSGDFTFTRATTATRVNSDGLVELVPYNLLQRSEEFDNAAWTKTAGGTGTAAVVTANVSTAPNGTLTADRVVFNRGSGTSDDFSVIGQTFASTSSGVLSFWIKSNTGLSQEVDIYGGVGAYDWSDTITVTNEWVRITYQFNVASNYFYIGQRQTIGTTQTADVLLWGAQVVEGTDALPYQKTETRLNIPRLDYSNGTCPSILLEPQRTNLLQQSSSFDNVYWGKGNVSVSANTTTAPDGTLTADKIIENTSNSNHEINHSNVPLSATSYSYSVYAKADGRNWIALSIQSQYTFFDLQNGVVGSSAVGNVNDIKSVGNGWYRCTITRTAAAANNFGLIRLALDDNTPTYTGDGTSGIYLWGAQLEAGSYATSYIPTTTASVTRNQEVYNRTGISSLIGQTEGTMFVGIYDYNFTPNNTSPYFEIYADSNNRIIIFKNTSNQYQVVVRTAGVTNLSITTASISGNSKIAIGYKENDCVVYVNGVQVGIDTSVTIPTCSNIYLGASITGVSVQKDVFNVASLWKTRLSNSELATLTSL